MDSLFFAFNPKRYRFLQAVLVRKIHGTRFLLAILSNFSQLFWSTVGIHARRRVANHAADDLRFSWTSKAAHTCSRRRGMRDDQQLITLQFAPTTRIRTAKLDEKYRPLVFITPGYSSQFVLAGVDFQQCTRPDYWVHGEITQTQMAINHLRRVISIPGNCFLRYQMCFIPLRSFRQQRIIALFESEELRKRRIGERFILFLIFNIDVVKTKEIQEVGAVDHAQAEELADAWFGGAVFQLGEPAV